MKKDQLGKTDLYVSPIGLGGAALAEGKGGYTFGPLGEGSTVQSLIEEAFELGVNVVDTAPFYGFGHSEEQIGKSLGSQRGNWVICSKSGISWHSSQRVNLTNCPKETARMLENSLRRLKTDYIDIFLIHYPDSRIDTRFAYEVLCQAKEKQQVRSIGLANTSIEEIEKVSQVAPVEVIQIESNVWSLEKNARLVEYAQKKSIGIMGYGSKKYRYSLS